MVRLLFERVVGVGEEFEFLFEEVSSLVEGDRIEWVHLPFGARFIHVYFPLFEAGLGVVRRATVTVELGRG